jgi:hypothetical protein
MRSDILSIFGDLKLGAAKLFEEQRLVIRKDCGVLNEDPKPNNLAPTIMR